MTRIDELADRIAELEELAATEGLRLPMPSALIALYEAEGHVVNLMTGEKLWQGAGLCIAPGPALVLAAGEGAR